MTEPVAHMTPEQFRQHGHEVVDWIADYWGRVGTLPVRSQVSPGDVRESLPAAAPEQGEAFSAVLADLD
ncbi:MAG TPA: aspartate aminotransferase family protein, partial [Blastococcus sp.]|nr:aspartate aminotransferase family protein [Blastococcus sp.]